MPENLTVCSPANNFVMEDSGANLEQPMPVNSTSYTYAAVCVVMLQYV